MYACKAAPIWEWPEKNFPTWLKNTLRGENLFHAFHGRYLSICYYCKGSCQSDKPLPNTTNFYNTKFLPRSSIFLTKISERSQCCQIIPKESFEIVKMFLVLAWHDNQWSLGAMRARVQDPADSIDWLPAGRTLHYVYGFQLKVYERPLGYTECTALHDE